MAFGAGILILVFVAASALRAPKELADAVLVLCSGIIVGAFACQVIEAFGFPCWSWPVDCGCFPRVPLPSSPARQPSSSMIGRRMADRVPQRPPSAPTWHKKANGPACRKPTRKRNNFQPQDCSALSIASRRAGMSDGIADRAPARSGVPLRDCESSAASVAFPSSLACSAGVENDLDLDVVARLNTELVAHRLREADQIFAAHSSNAGWE